ncbi:hypothetical protein QC760_001299 [Botrytis cinerea]
MFCPKSPPRRSCLGKKHAYTSLEDVERQIRDLISTGLGRGRAGESFHIPSKFFLSGGSFKRFIILFTAPKAIRTQYLTRLYLYMEFHDANERFLFHRVWGNIQNWYTDGPRWQWWHGRTFT